MSNMSYCRFENTNNDLRDCINALQEAIDESVDIAEFEKSLSSDYERRGFQSLVESCREFLEAYEALPESYDEE
jgi:hypothetical protein